VGAEEDALDRRVGRDGANIRLDSRGREVLRILPRVNDDVNEEWLATGPLHGRWPDPPPPRPSVAAPRRQAGRRDLGRGLPPWPINPGASVAASPATWSIAKPCSPPRSWWRAGFDLLEGRQTGLAYDASNLAAVASTRPSGIES
jgi:NADH-quinone oxidoreductase subunit G